MIQTFEELMISHSIMRALNEMGFEEPTPIQKSAIPVAMAGNDLIGQAQTGTGKTAAFGIPALEIVNTRQKKAQVLILSPTRELAIQVAEEINKMAQYMSVQAVPIYGGQDIQRQFRRLRANHQIIVATPGRLMDHLERGSITFESVRMVVLDEADEMLNMGFIDDINKILESVPEERQTLLFSATMPKAIQELANQYLKSPELIKMKPTKVTMDLIEQYYVEVQDRQKFDCLCRLLDMHAPELAIVFGRTKRRVDEVTEGLKKRGYAAEGIHGDLSQAKRDSVIRQFREGTIDILVATDVAARGLDISGVTHVYNYDLPQDPESYVHRVGRTGRAGNTGKAITFVVPREIDHLRLIERLTKRKIQKRMIPSIDEVIEGQQQIAIQNLIGIIRNNNEESKPYRMSAEALLEEYDSLDLVAAAIKLLTKEPDTTPVSITEEAPLRVRRSRKSEGKRNGRKGSERQGRSSSGRGRSYTTRNNSETGKRQSTSRKGNAIKREKSIKQGERRSSKKSTFTPYFKD